MNSDAINNKIEFDTLVNISLTQEGFLIEGYKEAYKSNYLSKLVKYPTASDLKSGYFIVRADGNPQFYYSKCFPLSERFSKSYAIIGDWIILRTTGGIEVIRYSKASHFKLEMRLWGNYFALHGRVEARALILRTIYYIFYYNYRKNKKKPIIIFSDRINKGGDNGEEMFLYALNNHKAEADVFFAVNKNSETAARLKNYGKVIKPNGWKYKQLYWKGAIMVSSQGEDWIFRPYKGYTEGFKDLSYNIKYVFLQHGITKDDLSGWLNMANKNISRLITATNFEYRSFTEGDYGYDNRQVKLTGFPRYDRLESKPEKIITIALTWRNYLVENLQKNGDRPLKSGFENTTYVKILEALLCSPEICDIASKYGYQLQFMFHPCAEALRPYLEEKCDRRIRLLPYSKSYNEIFSESSILLTDYSSVAFDFAYLYKPVMYLQMDADEFFSGTHMYKKGYFNYETDGFGEVINNLSQLKTNLSFYLANNCELKPMYRERIDKTFAFHDKNNCNRVWQQIMELI
jgi:CDP-glycerol glycerophosphotransferase (TagB/SpsB family)